MVHKTHIHQADVARGVAILLVFFFHAFQILFSGFDIVHFPNQGFLDLGNTKFLVLFLNPLGQGWMGVNLFLLISGFLIHLIYLRNRENFSVPAFFGRRFFRIYPAYLLCVLVCFFLTPQGHASGFKDLLYHLFFLHNLNDNTIFSINLSYWSIALEVQLYLLYPLYIMFFKHSGGQKIWIMLVIPYVLMMLVLCYSSFRSMAYSANVFCYAFVWAGGAWMAAAYHKGEKIFKYPFTLAFLFYLLFALSRCYFFSAFFMQIPATLACMAFFEWLIHLPSGKYKSASVFLSFTGSISYSIYLIHLPMLQQILPWFTGIMPGSWIGKAGGLGMSMILVYSLAWLIYKLVEQPGIALGRKLMG